MRDLKKEQSKQQSLYRLHLNRIKDEHRLYDKELALLFGWGVDQSDLVRKLRNGEAQIHSCDMRTLCKNIIQELGDMSLLTEMVPENWLAFAIRANKLNGCVKDEILNINKLTGHIVEEIQSKNPDANQISKYATAIASEASTMKQEVKG